MLNSHCVLLGVNDTKRRALRMSIRVLCDPTNFERQGVHEEQEGYTMVTMTFLQIISERLEG